MLLTILTIYASSVGLAENIFIAVFRISGQRWKIFCYSNFVLYFQNFADSQQKIQQI